MKILKTEINAVYPGNEGNRVGLSYGRIAYDKATENEKKIALGNKPEAIDEVCSITEKEVVKGLKGEAIEKAVKFNAAGEMIEAAITVTCGNYCIISVYLNGKLIGKADKTAKNTCVFGARSKEGENVLYFIADNALPDSEVEVTVSGKIKKITGPSAIVYLGKDSYAVTVDDKITIFRHDAKKTETVYSLSGLKIACASFCVDKATYYVAGMFYSGHSVIYEVDWDGRMILSIDTSLNYGSIAIYHDSSALNVYYVLGGALYYTRSTDRGTLDDSQMIFKGVKEVGYSACENISYLIYKDIYDRYFVCVAIGPLIGAKVNIGKVCRPYIPYGGKDIVICKNGSETTGSGCYSIDISEKTPKFGKPFNDNYPITVSDTHIVGIKNGEPVYLEELKK